MTEPSPGAAQTCYCHSRLPKILQVGAVITSERRGVAAVNELTAGRSEAEQTPAARVHGPLHPSAAALERTWCPFRDQIGFTYLLTEKSSQHGLNLFCCDFGKRWTLSPGMVLDAALTENTRSGQERPVSPADRLRTGWGERLGLPGASSP